jgi:hypothetical protein
VPHNRLRIRWAPTFLKPRVLDESCTVSTCSSLDKDKPLPRLLYSLQIQLFDIPTRSSTTRFQVCPMRWQRPIEQDPSVCQSCVFANGLLTTNERSRSLSGKLCFVTSITAQMQRHRELHRYMSPSASVTV